MTEQKASAPQFFSLLFLSVLSTVFMYISSPRIFVAQTEALLRPVVFVFISIFAGIPTFLVYKCFCKSKEKGLALKDTVYLRVIYGLYGIVYLIGAFKALLRFDLFASSELFPGTDMTFFLVGIIIVCTLLSLSGIGALCRGSVVFCFVVVGATAFVMVSLLDEFDVLNFTPLFTDGYVKFASDSLLFSLQTSEIGTIMLFLPDITGNIKKNYIRWCVLSGIAFTCILGFVIGSLGSFADTQLFPTYTAVTLASFGLLERIDALETAIWILCVVVKITFYILIVTRCFNKAVKKASVNFFSVAVCVVLCVLPSIISNNIESFGFVSNEPLSVILYSLAVVVLPLATLVYLKKVKPYEKIKESI